VKISRANILKNEKALNKQRLLLAKKDEASQYAFKGLKEESF